MKRSYRLATPSMIDRLTGDKNNFPFAVAILSWLIPQLYQQFEEELKDIEIDIIQIVHFGAYPGLGLYRSTTPPDFKLANQIKAASDRLIQEKTILELLQFFVNQNTDWIALTNKLMLDDEDKQGEEDDN